MKRCVLEKDEYCTDCKECNYCDYNSKKICDNCMQCIEPQRDFETIIIDKIITDDN